jgi:hypothetical protein
MESVMSIDHKGDSPAGRVMNEAIELDLEGRSPYPERASFIDADVPYLGKAIRRAVDNDMAIVLVATDGSTCTLRADPTGRMPAITRLPSRLSARMKAVSQTFSTRLRATPRH